MLKKAYLPLVQDGADYANGNWELSMAEATMAIAVFTEDSNAFQKALALWKRRVPAYIYLKSDGKTPHPSPGHRSWQKQYWYGLDYFEDGVCQETCRDLHHTQYGIMAAINLAETTYHQGVDLYSEEFDRLLAGLEFHAQFLAGAKP